MDALRVKIEGTAPLIMGAATFVDPLNAATVEFKKFTGTRKKTTDDLELIAEMEYRGAFYGDEKGRPVIPADVLWKVIVEGARKSKEGKIAEGGMSIIDDVRLIYDGPPTVDGLYKDRRFVYRVPVTVQRARTMKSRPRFHEWGAEFDVHYLPDIVDPDRLAHWIHEAGRLVGMMQRRPRFGKFRVVS